VKINQKCALQLPKHDFYSFKLCTVDKVHAVRRPVDNNNDVFIIESASKVSGVVSGTTVRALVLGRFSQKNKNRIERYGQKMNKNISYYKGVMLWQFGPPISALGLQDS